MINRKVRILHLRIISEILINYRFNDNDFGSWIIYLNFVLRWTVFNLMEKISFNFRAGVK